MIDHPKFAPQIVEGRRGEKPRAGAFYAVKKGDTLSRIAASAYGDGRFGAIQKINKNPHNLATNVYRAESTSCRARKVGPSVVQKMSSWSSPAQGWLSLCPGDRGDLERRLGFAYPIIWIPRKLGDVPKKAPEVQPRPRVEIEEPEVQPRPHTPVVLPSIDEQVVEPEPAPQPARAGVSPWLVGLFSAGIIGGIAWAILRK